MDRPLLITMIEKFGGGPGGAVEVLRGSDLARSVDTNRRCA